MKMVDWNNEESVQEHYKNTSRIVAAACRVVAVDGNEYIMVGARHWDSLMKGQLVTLCNMLIALGYTDDKLYESSRTDQGFIDQYQRFLSREEAWDIAVERKQIHRQIDDSRGKLYSEHLY